MQDFVLSVPYGPTISRAADTMREVTSDEIDLINDLLSSLRPNLVGN